MTFINKQRFLQELGGLLTFMSEEDRQEALMLYEKLFDDTDNEQALIQSLLSPTRQAVVIARAYNSGAGQEAAAGGAQTPAFVLAILQAYEECVPLPDGEPEPQLSGSPAAAEPAAVQERSLESFFEPSGEKEAEPEEQSPAEEPAEPVKTEEVTPLVLTAEPEETGQEEAAETEETKEAPAAEEEEEPTEEEEAAEFEEEVPPADELLFADEPEDEPAQPVEPAPAERTQPSAEGEKRAKPLMLVLFILAAAPLTALCIALLLIPTLACLGISAATIVGGCAGIVAAFGGFAIFADVLIVLGASLIVLALGLLFLWLFVWFVGGAIVGLVRTVVQVGESWCFEEVAA